MNTQVVVFGSDHGRECVYSVPDNGPRVYVFVRNPAGKGAIAGGSYQNLPPGIQVREK